MSTVACTVDRMASSIMNPVKLVVPILLTAVYIEKIMLHKEKVMLHVEPVESISLDL